ncbi:MAG: thermonuclease family protein [Alphaproteobacteria bacterium]|nr:thermonuclease family protein [Alphaproteobacteria bacterium]
MFGWRKKRDGFEWRSYVRTTILVKRKQRQDKLEDAKQAALEGLAEAGRAGVAAGQSGVEAAKRGLNVAAREAHAVGAKVGSKVKSGAREAGQKLGQSLGQGLSVAGRVARDSAASAGSGLWRVSRSAGGSIGKAAGSGLEGLAGGLGGMGRAMSPRVSLPLVIAAVAAAAGAVARSTQHGYDVVAITATLIAAGLVLLAVLPVMAGRATMTAPFSTRRYTGDDGEHGAVEPTHSPADFAGLAKALAAIIVAALLVGAGYLIAPLFSTDGLPVPVPKAGTVNDTIEGRAKAISGNVMDVGGEKVVLRGIEAPALRQSCTDKRGRKWRCGRSALTALRKITGYETVVCKVAETDREGRKVADCMVGETNIAAELVKDGKVFAGTGFFRAYGSEEEEAKSAKRGIWQGKAERPSERAEN